MNIGVSGMTTYTSGDVSSVGGKTPQSQEFAKSICTKLGACQAVDGQQIPTPTGRGR
jgi:hypothetical protein